MLSLLLTVAMGVGTAMANVSQNTTAGRSLPSGEEKTRIVQAIYQSPKAGEMLLLSGQDHKFDLANRLLLRLKSGMICQLDRVEGPQDCDNWVVHPGGDSMPHGCSFVFTGVSERCSQEVKSAELTETNLFSNVHRLIKVANGTL